MMGDSFCTSSYETDEIPEGSNYIYIERDDRVYEDPYQSNKSPTPNPRQRHKSMSGGYSPAAPPANLSPSSSPSAMPRSSSHNHSPRLPPRNQSPPKYARTRLRSKSPTKNIINRRQAAHPGHQHQSSTISRLSVKSIDESKGKILS